jgi:hypothetical protein
MRDSIDLHWSHMITWQRLSSIDKREDCSSLLITLDDNQTDLHDVDEDETKKSNETIIEKIRSA